MKIALIGYGKMGKTIDGLAQERGHEVVLRAEFPEQVTLEALQQADVAIEFTQPNAAVSNILACFEANLPVVVGTTAWYEQFEEVKTCCLAQNQTLFTATNFSLGVNLFWEANRHLARLMNNYTDYKLHIHEIHHTQKLDAPSGTAITTAEVLLDELKNKTNWVLGETSDPSLLSITAERIDPAPGTHIVRYESEVDTIELSHIAHNRKGFALGAIVAAEWLVGKKGVFTMTDLLKFV